MSETTRARYVSSGPLYPGETAQDAMNANVISHVVRHAVRQPPAPGHGFEDEPLDGAERAAQRTGSKAAAFDHATTSRGIRAALRPGTA